MRQPREFYQAKALLLGMIYDPDIHVLWRLDNTQIQYDADTMEPISETEIRNRIVEHIDSGELGWAVNQIKTL